MSKYITPAVRPAILVNHGSRYVCYKPLLTRVTSWELLGSPNREMGNRCEQSEILTRSRFAD